jgi:hypothetical protein
MDLPGVSYPVLEIAQLQSIVKYDHGRGEKM